ncbi:Ig-like domain-containing protein [Micromonospora sp. HM5-17]|uniref:L,D-transpeptidase n=1 Tax=Micromonospora sp. HM5-17 TaxID=2487710 RepID=UPI000F4856F6|nr:Ig-like domain-containing protein [Micromonospora sp. HM5-17]ROT31855.1 L,D-transpeptidase [Micromonospora sp. HM5-17]
MVTKARAWAAIAALAVVAPFGLAGCGGDEGERPSFVNGTTGDSGSPNPPAEPLELTVTPANGAKKQPVSTEIGTSVKGGKITNVKLTAEGGGTVPGAMREDGSSWVPASPLKYGKTYTAEVTATTPSGQTETKTTTFTTMAKPKSVIGSGLYLFDDKTYGVAMPVVVEFSPGIPKKDRATVQRRMFVETDPPQPGTWYWVANGTQAYYRAPEYWKPGTTLKVRIGLEGIPLSNGRYGNVDRKATAKIGSRFEMKVDNATKKMSVYEDGKLIRTMPVSLGKKSTPSSSGTMVIMEKKKSTVFDTRDDPNPANRYVTEIDFAQRLTWGGEYIHAAPWSVGDQGRRNVSHGCVNVSTPNARWLFERTKIGDPVTIAGTERKLADGNGWTAWNLSWEEFVKGSALPVPDNLGS